jgi:glutathione synthase/RimK-type ligase-like ATP-grasp enzyme
VILLIGNNQDPHLLSIKQNIENLGNQAIILSTEREDLLNTQFSYHSNKQNLIIMQNNQCISVNNITAVFCLSPLYTRKGFISSNEKDFWHFTWREALYGFYARLSQRAYFVNKNIPTALFAQNKIQFFDVARKANINTPDTWIGNKTQDINEFFDNYDKVVIKTMHQIYLEHQDEQAMFLVKPVNKSQFHNFNSQNECPVFLQQAIDKLFDVRAIIIGKKVIGCKIDASLSKVGNLDWRAYDLPNTIHEPFELPNKVQGKLLNILKYFNLDYACLDLCVDKHGEFWLLDVNPFGRYMWIELSVGIDISNEIAKFLISKSTLNSNVKN